MKEKIEQLIQEQIDACQELEFLLNDLHALRGKANVKELIEKNEIELEIRKAHIDSLKDIL